MGFEVRNILGDVAVPAGGTRGFSRRFENNRTNALLLALIVVAVFLNTLGGQFILDDLDVIYNSEIVRNLEIVKIFTLNYWHDTTADNLYRPLTVLTYALDWKISGGNPIYFHAVNVTIHFLVTLALYRTLKAMGVTGPASLGASALFAVHPIHGEAINIITGRAELMAALFVLTGLHIRITGKKASSWAVPLLYAAALLSKESGAVLLPLILVTDLYLERSILKPLNENRRLYASMLLVIALWALWNYGYVQAESLLTEAKYNPSDNPLAFYVLTPRLIGALEIQLKYLLLMTAPARLQLVYGAADLGQTGAIAPAHALAVLAPVLALAAATVLLWKKNALAAWAAASMAIAVLPTSNLLLTLEPLMAERFMYLPSAFFAAMLVPGLLAQLKKPPWKKAAALGLAVYITVLSGLTVKANANYRNAAVLWDSVFEKAKKNGRIWYYRSSEYLIKGDLANYEKTAREGIKTDPLFPDTYYQLSVELIKQARYGEAHELIKGIAGKPYASKIAKAVEGISLFKIGDPDGAERLFEEIKNDRTQKGGKEYCYLYALIKAGKGDMDAALPYFERAAPIIADEKDLRAVTLEYIKRGNGESALKWATMLNEIKTGGPSQNLLGIAHAYQKNYRDAVTHFRRAVTLSPGTEEYKINLQRAETMLGEGTKTP